MAGIELDMRTRKREEEALRESEQRFRAIFEQAAVGGAQIETRSGRFVRVNQRYADILTMTKEEMTETDFAAITLPDDLQRYMDQMRQLLLGRIHTFSTEMRYRRRDGSLIWVKVFVSPMWAYGQEPTSHIAVIEDITERKTMEEALRESQERYRSLVSQATDIIYTAGLDGRFTFVNEAASAIMGYSHHELVGMHYLDLIVPDSRSVAQKFYQQQLHDLTPSTYFEFPAVTKDGREVWFGQHVRLRVADGKPIGIEAIARDITERKSAEAALRESEERFAKTFQSSPHAILITDVESGRCLDANRACTEIFGHVHGEIVGRTTIELGLWAVPEAWHRFVERVQRESGVRNLEMTLPTKFGSVRECLVSSEMIMLKGNDCLVTIANDVTDLKLAQAALQEAYQRLQVVTRRLAEAEEAERRRIARELHDEFGQTLTGLKLDIAWIARRLSALNEFADVSAMQAKASVMSKAVDGLISSVRETAATLRPGVLDDLGLAAGIEWLAATFEERTGVPCRLMLDVGDYEKDIVPELATTVFRCAQELLTNVMRHAQASSVFVQLMVKQGSLELVVRDNGKGIRDKQWENDTSLGLRGLHERVRLFNGRVVISGTPGVGTEAVLQFPLSAPMQPMAQRLA
jgi:PAS domain S-box-containing protein